MMKLLKVISSLVLLILFQQNLSAQDNCKQQWPSFRGPFASGILDSANIPTTWDIDDSTNILWKTPIPGLGHSCPVIWDNKLFVTTAISSDEEESLRIGLYGDIRSAEDTTVHKFKVYCLDKNNGEILWEQLAFEGVPRVKRHTKGSFASPTTATDGEYLVAFFGSQGLYCYDLNGNFLWERDLGPLNSGFYRAPDFEWGYSSSPVLYKGKIIVQIDITNGESYLAAYDVKTGEQIWKVARDEYATWSAPTVMPGHQRDIVLVNGYKHIGGYDLDTGDEVWKMHGGGDIPVPTPVVVDSLIYINNAHGKMSPIYAIRTDVKGDISLPEDSLTNEYIVWSIKRGGAYMQTPLIYRGYLYNLRGNGLLTCFDAKTGEEMYKEPLKPEGGITASGIVSDNKLYFSAENGDVYVIKAGPVYELLAKNSMEDVVMATPALSDSAIYFRTQHFLVAIGN